MAVYCKCGRKAVLASGYFDAILEADSEPYESGVEEKARDRNEIEVYDIDIHVHYCEDCDQVVNVWSDFENNELAELRAENASLAANVYETSRVMLVQVDALNRILEISNNPTILAIAQKAIDEKWEPEEGGK